MGVTVSQNFLGKKLGMWFHNDQMNTNTIRLVSKDQTYLHQAVTILLSCNAFLVAVEVSGHAADCCRTR